MTLNSLDGIHTLDDFLDCFAYVACNQIQIDRGINAHDEQAGDDIWGAVASHLGTFRENGINRAIALKATRRSQVMPEASVYVAQLITGNFRPLKSASPMYSGLHITKYGDDNRGLGHVLYAHQQSGRVQNGNKGQVFQPALVYLGNQQEARWGVSLTDDALCRPPIVVESNINTYTPHNQTWTPVGLPEIQGNLQLYRPQNTTNPAQTSMQRE